MQIIQAKDEHFFDVKKITQRTIQEIYPHYYPRGVVDFFLLHHNDQNIMQDIQSGYVYLIYDEDKQPVGTVTMKANEINRLFVLPQYQRNGIGRQLMNFAENEILKEYKICQLDASLPAKIIYSKRDYIVSETHVIETECGDFLCYDVMIKEL